MVQSDKKNIPEQLTSRSLQEKSFFFFPGAQFSGLPAASVHRGEVRSRVYMFVCVFLYVLKATVRFAKGLQIQLFLLHFCTLKMLILDCFWAWGQSQTCAFYWVYGMIRISGS